MESALDGIIKEYVKLEMSGEDETGAEKSLDHNHNYLQELHECLERKGVMRELQAFLRQKLVMILQDKWPQLSGGSGSEPILPVVLLLLQDFFSSRKLLYTLSVFASELGLKNKANFAKMRCSSAERLLEELNIQKDSETSRLILKKYLETERSSLLECVIQCSSWMKENLRTDLPQMVPNSAEDRLILQNLSRFHEKPATSESSRFKKIDKLIDTGRKSGGLVHLKRIGVEQRFESLQNRIEEMERDKNSQVQMAITKFREEEESKIREEMKNKFEFEMSSKEKEMLSNFKERVEFMRESLEVEKASWKAEKERQEVHLKEKERKLRHELESLAKRSENNGQNTNRACSSEVADKLSLLSFTQNEEDCVLKEAKLLVHIKQLNEENKRLKSLKPLDDPYNQLSAPPSPRSICRDQVELSAQRNFVRDIERDKVAFLQYNLEQQSEEIKQLKKQLSCETNNLPSKPTNDTSTDILNFLKESKRRCEQIEEEAKSVENKLIEICRKSSHITTLFTPRQKLNSSIYASIFPQVVAEQLHIINAPLRSQMNIPLPTSNTNVLPNKSQDVSKINFTLEHKKPPDTHSNPQSVHAMKPSSSSTRQNKEKSRLAKAVERGALSFEKLSSSSEMDEDNSLLKSFRGQGRKISFSKDIKKKQGNNNIGNNSEAEEPVKLVHEDNSEKSVSFSLSGPASQSQKSRGSLDESDFWKL